MGSQAKILIPVGFLGLVVAALVFWRLGLAPGIGVLVVASLAVVAVGQRTATTEPPARSLDEAVPADQERWPADLRPGEPLATWTPPRPIDLPAPPTETVGTEPAFPFADEELPAHDGIEPAHDEPAYDEPAHDEPAHDGIEPVAEPVARWDDGSTWSSTPAVADRNPLDDLVVLDGVDVIAEVERIEAGGAPEPGPGPARLDTHVVNEAVSSPDDIMAASHATELAVDGPAADNSELAKLLAKVQARLAAYE